MSRFKDVHGRFVPPREWELVAFGLAGLAIAGVPLAWFLHGASTAHDTWIVILIAAVLTGRGLWLRRKRLVNSRPILPQVNGS
jgi:hypothetical protein